MKETSLKIEWEVDPAKCNGCGDCMIICPVKALKVVKKVAIMADPASCCRESCRICEYNCPEEAIIAY